MVDSLIAQGAASPGAAADGTRLESVLRDVVALATLPTIWAGASAARIAESLAASLFTMLDAEFVYVGLAQEPSGPLLPVAQVSRFGTDAALAARVGPAIAVWSRTHDPEELLVLPVDAAGKRSMVAARPIGHGAEWGAIGVAFASPAIPGALEHLLLGVAATQAATAAVNVHLARTRQERSERLRAALHAADTGTFLWSLRDDALACDDSLERLLDLAPGESAVTLDDFLARIHPEDRAQVRGMCEQCVRDGTDFDLEYRLLRRDGAIRWMHEKARIVAGADGTPEYLSGACVDVTARRQAQRDREDMLESERAARAEAERANRLKDQFLANLSHELRTPLNAILGWSHILAASGSDAVKLAKGLAVIERNARLQAELIDELLDMSRIVSGKLTLELKRVDVAAMVRAAVESMGPAATAKRIALEAAIEARLGTVRADPGRIQQIVWNLLSNAVKFTPEGGHVEVALVQRPGQVEIRVRDDGVGIAPDFLPCLFERFRQADSSSTRTHGGLGLGLAIVRSIVEMHGGTVRAESAGRGRGSTFTVALPLAVGEDGASPAEVPGEALQAGVDRAMIEGVEVLVVDDEPDVRDLVCRILEDCGARVLAVPDASAALAALEGSRPDVILSDIGLPGEDGYTFLRRLRGLSRGQGSEVPAVALTAFARDEDRARALDAGFQMHIAKPLLPADLIRVVASIAGRVPPEGRPGKSGAAATV